MVFKALFLGRILLSSGRVRPVLFYAVVRAWDPCLSLRTVSMSTLVKSPFPPLTLQGRGVAARAGRRVFLKG